MGCDTTIVGSQQQHHQERAHNQSSSILMLLSLPWMLGSVFIACVNSKGSSVKSWTFKSTAFSSAEGQAQSALATIECAHTMNDEHALLIRDAQDIVEGLLHRDTYQTAANWSIIHNDLLSHFVSWNIIYIPRANSFLAYNLVKWASTSRFEGLTPYSLLPFQIQMRHEEVA